MRAPISVIIPTLNAAGSLPDCLASLAEGLNAGLIRDLTISDGGSNDSTDKIAEAAGAQIITGPASRGGQLGRGVAATRGDWLLCLHADTRLQPGWTTPVLQALQTPGAYHFRLQFDATGTAPKLVAGWANLRSHLFRLPYGDQGLLIDRQTYTKAGGYPDIPLMEDVALARALRQIRPLQATALTSAAKYQSQGWLTRGSRNLATLIKYLTGTSPEALAQHYRKP